MQSEKLTLLPIVDPETRKEFEEQQKKSVFSGGASQPNPLQNFDMASWMAGRSSTPTPNTGKEGGGNGGGEVRRRG